MTTATTVLNSEGTGETIVFWVLAPLAVIAALGVVFSRKAVHAALLLAFDMICLAVFYIAQGAAFLGVVQIVVYTGAVMMLFLFVLMLVGVDASDSLVETIRGQRWLALVVAVGFGILAVTVTAQAATRPMVGLGAANADGNVEGIAALLFSNYVFAFEATSALLITAAVGAMVLAHRERLVPRLTQREMAEERFRVGTQVTPLPVPGVYARHNAVDTPALLPDGSIAESSINRMLQARTGLLDPHPVAARTEAVERGVAEGDPVVLTPGPDGAMRESGAGDARPGGHGGDS